LAPIDTFNLIFRIQVLQFDSGVGGGELPVYILGLRISVLRPSGHLPAHGGDVRNPTVKTLSAQHAQFTFRYIEPTPMLGRMMNLQTFRQGSRFIGDDLEGEYWLADAR